MTPTQRPPRRAPVGSLTVACLATALAGAWGEPTALGIAVLAVIMLILSLGWRGSRGAAWALAGIFAVFAALFLAIVAFDDPDGPPRLLLGLPASTAVLVYGVWPLGVLPSLLYAYRFRDSVLPEDRLERFLAEHSRRLK